MNKERVDYVRGMRNGFIASLCLWLLFAILLNLFSCSRAHTRPKATTEKIIPAACLKEYTEVFEQYPPVIFRRLKNGDYFVRWNVGLKFEWVHKHEVEI